MVRAGMEKSGEGHVGWRGSYRVWEGVLTSCAGSGNLVGMEYIHRGDVERSVCDGAFCRGVRRLLLCAVDGQMYDLSGWAEIREKGVHVGYEAA